MHTTRSRLLRRTLAANASFSTLCAASCLFAAPTLAPAMGLPSALPLYAVSAILLPFAAALAHNAWREQISTFEATLASLADFAWVLASALVLALPFAPDFTELGLGLIVAVAIVVGTCAIGQLLGLRRMQPDKARRDTPRRALA